MKIDCNSDGQVHTPPTPALTCATTTLAFATTTLATTFTLATAALTPASITSTATGGRARTGGPLVESAGTIPARSRSLASRRVEKLNDVFPTTWKVTLAKPDATMGFPYPTTFGSTMPDKRRSTRRSF